MTMIGGAGGPGGIGGAGGPDGPGAADDVDVSQGEQLTEVGAPGASHGAAASEAAGVARAHGAAAAGELDALSADIAAGRLSPHEAIDRLVEATAGPELGAAERAELRELLTDLIANDPHLAGLAGRI